jgi:hypothetical protein
MLSILGNNSPAKKHMTTGQIKHLTGKRIDLNKWYLPEGYEVCEITGKMHPVSELETSFPHYLFDREMLVTNRIYVEDAAWLSEEGYGIVLTKLGNIGVDYWQVIDDYMTEICANRQPNYFEALAA